MKKPNEKKTPQQYAAEISKTWTKSVPSIFNTGMLCAEAKDKLDADERQVLLDQLKGSMTTGNFSKLVKIGTQSKRLLQIQDKLPPNYTTLYLIAGLKEAQLQKALAEGLIHPNVSREEVLALASGKAKPTSDLLGKLFALEGCQEQTRLDVTDAIEALAAKYEGQVGLKLPLAAKTVEQKQAA